MRASYQIVLAFLLLPFFGKTQDYVVSGKIRLPVNTFVQDVLKTSENVFVLTISYKEDHNSSYALFSKYDSNLKQVWSIRIDSTSTNDFSQIIEYNGGFLLIGEHGKKDNYNPDLNVFAYNISEHGKVLGKSKIPQPIRAHHKALLKNDQLHFTISHVYKDTNTSRLNTKAVYALYDLKQQKLLRNEVCDVVSSFTSFLFKVGEEVYILGKVDDFKSPQELLLLQVKEVGFEVQSRLFPPKEKIDMDVYFDTVSKHLYVPATYYSDTLKYLHMYHFDLKLNLIKDSVFTTKQMGIHKLHSHDHFDGEGNYRRRANKYGEKPLFKWSSDLSVEKTHDFDLELGYAQTIWYQNKHLMYVSEDKEFKKSLVVLHDRIE